MQSPSSPLPLAPLSSVDSGGRKSGVPLPAEIKAHVQELIEKHPEKSAAAIAAMAGVSKPTVNRIRNGGRR
jgi:DNA invertase Pin-like site-specific DNA recombinase